MTRARPGMRAAMLDMLAGRPARRIVWTADVSYWVFAQRCQGRGEAAWETEQGHLDFCNHHGCMPYYWYGSSQVCRPIYDGVFVRQESAAGLSTTVWHCPAGELREESRFMAESFSTSLTKHAVETKADLETLLYVLRRRRLEPMNLSDYSARVIRWEAADGIPLIACLRSPLPALFTDWAGVQNAVYLLADHEDLVREILSLIEAQEQPILDAICSAPPPLVHFCDNLSSENLTGYFDEFMAAPYRRRLDRLHEAGVRCAVHLDGTVRGLLPKLAAVGIDAIEALTPAPVGDVAVEEMRRLAANNRVILWGGLPGAMFAPPFTWEDMRSHLLSLLAAWSTTPFVVGVADQIPPNGDITLCAKISDLLNSWHG